MVTSTRRPNRRHFHALRTLRRTFDATGAFTLVEMMIGSTLGAIVLAGVLSTFLMLGRSGTNIVSYMTMDAQVRKGLENFSQDARMASNITWNSSTSITLTVPDNYASTSNQVTYAWDSTNGFFRMPGNAAANNTKTTFIRNITSFSYSRYDKLNSTATTDAATKSVRLSITITTTAITAKSVTDQILSAAFVLRNKLAT